MRIAGEKLRALCRQRHLSLKALLAEAGVSRTAYYSLLRKDSVLPKSVDRIARRLEVSPSGFLDDETGRLRHLRKIQERAEAICRQHPDCDRDVVFRTLKNLELPPIERLRRALVRARKPIFTDKEVAFLRELTRNKVAFIIVGLSAAAFQGAPMVTQDVDIWFRDITHPGIRKALKKLGGILAPAIGLNPPRFIGEAMDRFNVVPTMHGIDSFDKELKTAAKVPLGDFSIHILPLDRIIASKTYLNRQKDRAVLPALRSASKALMAHHAKQKKSR